MWNDNKYVIDFLQFVNGNEIFHKIKSIIRFILYFYYYTYDILKIPCIIFYKNFYLILYVIIKRYKLEYF